MKLPFATFRLTRSGRWTRRKLVDVGARLAITSGGIMVIFSIVLIGVFLLWMVAPLFAPADMHEAEHYTAPPADLAFATDDYLESAYSFNQDGALYRFGARTGKPLNEPLPFTRGAAITSRAVVLRNNHLYAMGLENGGLLLRKVDFQLTYPDGTRQVVTNLLSPWGEDPLPTELESLPVTALAVAMDGDSAMAATYQPGPGLSLLHYALHTSFLTGDTQPELINTWQIPQVNQQPLWLGIDQLLDWLYVLTPTRLRAFALRGGRLNEVESIGFDKLGRATSAAFLLGNISLLVGFDSGKLVQVFPVHETGSASRIAIAHNFPALPKAIVDIAPEYTRRGFAAVDAGGKVGMYYSSNETRLGTLQLAHPVRKLEMTPRHQALLGLGDDNRMQVVNLHNQYPEISFGALWRKIWYEFYPKPDYVWQSSSAASDFEPKFSLAPLTFGTLKAAFYAMLVAVPLAIMGAIYTAFFLSSRLRQFIKPVIELMEALPTVILGFLAGLWLAPFVENNLTFLFCLLLGLAPLTIGFGFGLHSLQARYHNLPGWLAKVCSEEWRIALLVPTVLVYIFICLHLQGPVEQWLFGGNMRGFITNSLGLGFDQRNAMIIGLAMGFAVIPTIFSITEDAIFSVPKHLISGSLALGASRWQTLVGVVLPTASPGIFSAVMIGMGRAVGETMIVLMATGNTPVMNWNIFEGMRTLSANIAVEMPESEVGSSHYRILFLAGLVLFVFTFVVNTLAELVRQNLRKRFSTL